MSQRVSIRPGVSVLSVLRHLNYKPWYALAEFVDNSIQSYKTNLGRIREVDGPGARLSVKIKLGTELDPRLIVRDNAAGIAAIDYDRAFKTAEVPLDRSGLSEFGMGMKSAACWFAKRWQVRSAALGEGVERLVSFDVAAIVKDGLEELPVVPRPVSPKTHFTEIILEDLHKPPQGRTRGKMREHLASIYRVFLRSGLLELTIDDEPVEYETSRILVAPYHETPDTPPVEWKKEIDFDFGAGLKAKGFAALRERGSTSDAGFALFRRNRLIEGSNEDGYRPEFIFGKSNSYRYQRLFGELELEGFGVSHTKDGFQWDENEDAFLELLKDELEKEPLPLLSQAEEYRALRTRTELTPGVTGAIDRTADSVRHGANAIDAIAGEPPESSPPSQLDPGEILARRDVHIKFRGENWVVAIETTNDPAVSDCIEVSEQTMGQHRIEVRLCLAHPFMQKWVGSTAKEIEPFLRLAVALGLAEVTAHLAGVKYAGTVRRNVNELLTHALSGS